MSHSNLLPFPAPRRTFTAFPEAPRTQRGELLLMPAITLAEMPASAEGAGGLRAHWMRAVREYRAALPWCSER